MSLLRSLGLVGVCFAAVTAVAVEKEVTITWNNGNKTCQADDVSLSHDSGKDEKVHWKSADNAYLISFKNNLSPCHADRKTGSQMLTISVPPASANDTSDVCHARKRTNTGNYHYTIYFDDGAGNWQKCSDPVVIVSDGRATASAKTASKAAKKKRH